MKKPNIIDKAFFLKKGRLFSKLDLDLLLTIADRMEFHFFREEEKIFRYDQEAKNMYLITSGCVRIDDSKGECLARLEEGEFFGDESIFSGKNREYTATCESTVTVLSLTRNHILGIISECPSVGIALLESYTKEIIFRDR